eukprot:scaffold20357_cov39-Cyclotella_meneghiniana.AAC.2
MTEPTKVTTLSLAVYCVVGAGDGRGKERRRLAPGCTKAFAPSATSTLHTIQTQQTHHSNNVRNIKQLFMADENEIYRGSTDDPISQEVPINKLTKQEQIQIVIYRLALLSSALFLCIQAVLGNSSFFEGSGINVKSIMTVSDQSKSLLPIATGASLTFCPLPNDTIEFLMRSLGILTAVSGVVATNAVIDSSVLPSQTPWILTLATIAIISTREIYYYGIEYKQECILILASLPFMLGSYGNNADNDSVVPVPILACALGLSVLTVTKILEPMEEDLIRSNSEFLSK